MNGAFSLVAVGFESGQTMPGRTVATCFCPMAMRAHGDMVSQLMVQHPASALGSPGSVAEDVIDDRVGVLVGHATIIAHVACHVKCHESLQRRGLPRVGAAADRRLDSLLSASRAFWH
jgi:hypothetical protein